MQVDYIIIGQGICGTLLSWNLINQGQSVMVTDHQNPNSASNVASGVINPVTGRRIVRTWMIEDLLPFALQAYSSLGNQLNTPLVQQCNVLDFHPTPQMQEAFLQRLPEEPDYLQVATNEEQWQKYFRYNYGIGEVNLCLLINLHNMLAGWRKKLIQQESLLNEVFNINQLSIQQESGKIICNNITAKKIIFCDGVAGFNNPYFNKLPYVRTKGEAIIASIPGLPRTNIYKQGITIVPWHEDLFWIGSNYVWEYSDLQPSPIFRKKIEEQLNYWLRLPYTIVDHLVSERPANIERRPFIGLHPLYPQIAVFNGMGTKGCSLAPYFADQFTQHLVHNKPLNPLVDIKRFTRILSM